MDPQTVLYNLLDAIARNDRAKVSECLEALQDWNDKGGFLPQVVKPANNEPASFIVSSKSDPKHRILLADKLCDGCGHNSVIITIPIDRGSQELKTGDDCFCSECELVGTVVLHGATPSSEDIEAKFDVSWIDPETGGNYRI